MGAGLAGDGVYAMSELRGNRTRNRQRPLQCACWGACTIRRHDFSPALRKAAEQFCPQFFVLRVLQQLQVGVLAGGEMIICRHLVGCFVGQFDYEDSFGDFCGSRVAVLIGSFYCGSLRVGGTIHRIHRPHSFPQFIYLLLCQCRNGCALFIS